MKSFPRIPLLALAATFFLLAQAVPRHAWAQG